MRSYLLSQEYSSVRYSKSISYIPKESVQGRRAGAVTLGISSFKEQAEKQYAKKTDQKRKTRNCRKQKISMSPGTK